MLGERVTDSTVTYWDLSSVLGKAGIGSLSSYAGQAKFQQEQIERSSQSDRLDHNVRRGGGPFFPKTRWWMGNQLSEFKGKRRTARKSWSFRPTAPAFDPPQGELGVYSGSDEGGFQGKIGDHLLAGAAATKLTKQKTVTFKGR